MFKIYDGREKFYQWDLDRKLIVEDPEIKEVHFCNRTDDCSLVCETYIEDGVTLANVPNILLQTDWRIHVYAYDGSYTKHDECYEVISRSKPADYEYTETEILNWSRIEERVNVAIEEANAATEAAAIAASTAVKATDASMKATEDAITATTGANEAADRANIAATMAEITANNMPNYFANALKGNESSEVVAITDISPVEHELKVKVSDATAKVLKYGGNILDIEGREVVYFGANANTTKRTFTGKGIIKGLAYNNYYTPSNVTSFEKIENGFSFSNKANQISYGIGFDFKSAPNTVYVVSYEGLENVNASTIFMSEYDKDGNYLRYKFPSSAFSDNESKGFMTGENTAWVVISIRNPVAETVVDYNNVYVSIGKKLDEFEEYKEPVTYTPNADGTVEGVKSIYPSTTLITDTPGVLIDCEYNRDINKAFAELQNAIISLGGNV